MEEVPFEVTPETVVEDMSDVKEQRSIVPASSNVKVRVSKAASMSSKDKDIKSLKLELRIADGIEVTDKETGEVKLAYVNKPLFTGIMDLVYWGDTSVKGRAEKNWWKNKQHLVGFKKFCLALDLDVKEIKVNDEFYAELIGKELLVDIQHEEETAPDASGDRVKLGTFRERLRNFKKAE